MKSSRKQSVISNMYMYRYAYAEYLMYLGVDSGRLAEVNRNQIFIDIMKKTLASSELALETGAGFLAQSSIVTEETLIESVGQELGLTYNFSDEIDSNTGKTFSHER